MEQSLEKVRSRGSCTIDDDPIKAYSMALEWGEANIGWCIHHNHGSWIPPDEKVACYAGWHESVLSFKRDHDTTYRQQQQQQQCKRRVVVVSFYKMNIYHSKFHFKSDNLHPWELLIFLARDVSHETKQCGHSLLHTLLLSLCLMSPTATPLLLTTKSLLET